MELTVEDDITAALDHRRVLSFTYDGQSRTVNPHALYHEAQHRRLVLYTWQTYGGSNSGVLPGWKNFHVDEITGLVVLDETFFGTQPDFNPRRFRHLVHSI